jgi:hypothetical protein
MRLTFLMGSMDNSSNFPLTPSLSLQGRGRRIEVRRNAK